MSFWLKYFDVKSTCSVKDYWKIMLIHLCIYISLFFSLIFGQLLRNNAFDVLGPIGYIAGKVIVLVGAVMLPLYFGLTVLPNFTITLRRLHDADFSWYVLLLLLIPNIGPLTLAYCLTIPGINDEWSFKYM
ncbi:DUF805 domain-containing protein [Lactococcus petauri]|uniref:DUF805 domain-containing protein n=1 Tax=Lactococcus petauri TaxID=1940789 RepID=UPI003D6F5F7E